MMIQLTEAKYEELMRVKREHEKMYRYLAARIKRICDQLDVLKSIEVREATHPDLTEYVDTIIQSKESDLAVLQELLK